MESKLNCFKCGKEKVLMVDNQGRHIKCILCGSNSTDVFMPHGAKPASYYAESARVVRNRCEICKCYFTYSWKKKYCLICSKKRERQQIYASNAKQAARKKAIKKMVVREVPV